MVHTISECNDAFLLHHMGSEAEGNELRQSAFLLSKKKKKKKKRTRNFQAVKATTTSEQIQCHIKKLLTRPEGASAWNKTIATLTNTAPFDAPQGPHP